jgi:hypothetical protein
MGIPYWGTFHGLGLNSSSGWKKGLFYFLENHCFQKLDKIFLLNQPDVDIVQKVYKNKVYKHQSLGLGCNLEKFNPTNFSENTRATLRQALGFSNKKSLLLQDDLSHSRVSYCRKDFSTTDSKLSTAIQTIVDRWS